MPKTKRTPPPSPKTKLTHAQSLSESDLTTVASSDTAGTHITVRCKRQRIDDSPNKQITPITKAVLDELKCELLEMLTTWKAEHDQMLKTWKTDQDATLTKLTSEISDLRKQFQSIQTVNLEIERSINFINDQYENINTKVQTLEKKKLENDENISQLQKQLQDLHFQSRQATIEIRNVPNKDHEKPDELFSIVSRLGKTVNMDIREEALRDIYRIPGKTGLCRPIVAEFCCVNTRNDLLTKVRQYNKVHSISDKLNTQTIGVADVKSPIYVDEFLPSSIKKLMYKTRKFCRTHNYSCWYSNGRILLRKRAGEKPIVVKSEKCLTMMAKQDQ